MALPTGVWGIDLGQCALKALRMELQGDQVVATAFDYVEHPKILSQPDADPDQLTREALEKFLSRNSLRGDTVAISVPGQSGLARFVKLPPVEEKKIGDIVRFEAKQQIPFNLDEVVWDYQKIGSGVVADGFAMETEIGLFAMKRDMVSRYLQHFKDVNVEVHIVQMAPLCLCNYVAYDLLNVGADPSLNPEAGKKRCVVALDIGTDSSNLVITDGVRIIWQRPIPLGGNHFTRALTKDLKLTFAKAEHLKRNATKSAPADLKKILTSLKPVLNDFVGEVQRSLGYFTNTHRDANVEYMMGLGSAFRLPGLQKFLAEKLQLDVRKLGKLERLTGDSVVTAPAFNENVLSFAVAYGLALQGLAVARLQTNLLPPEIQVERLIRAKKPWAVAAAAALLAGTFFGPYLGYALDFRAVNTESEPLKPAVAESESVSKRASDLKRQFDEKEKAAKAEEDAVKSIISGQEERPNWIELHKFISESVPRPDGSNLSDRPRREFFLNKGQAAYAKYLARRAAAGGKDEMADIDPNLVQFNIVGFDARYFGDLAAVYTALTGGKPPVVDKKDIRPVEQANTPPKEKEGGWLVELRGYTYHVGGRRFVLDGLVQAIANAGVKTRPAASTPGTTSAAGATTPAPASATSPAAPDGTTPAGSTPENDHRVIDRVSHVMLFKVMPSDTGTLINSSAVAGLAGGQGGGGYMGGAAGTAPPGGGGAAEPGGGMGGMPPGGMGMMGGMVRGGESGGAAGGAGNLAGSRGNWRPLLGGAASGGGFAGMMPGGGGGMMGAGAGTMPPAGMSVPPMGAGMVPPGGGMTTPLPGGGTTTTQPSRSTSGRTEFIILLFWKEHAPSDKYLPEPPPTETTGGGGMMSPTPGGGGGMMSPTPGGGGMPSM
jgi:type IV pilus assembly protein PilM